MLRSGVVYYTNAHLFGDGKQPFPRTFDRRKNILTPGCIFSFLPVWRKVTWTESYEEAVGAEYLKRRLDALKQFGEPDDVRLIFSFDS